MKQNKPETKQKIDLSQFAPRRNLSLPNLLSALRILLIPAIFAAYFRGQPVLTVAVIVFSGLTDVLDGFIARHWRQVTALGKVLDPLADKLTQLALAICLCFSFPAAVPLVLVLVVKELTMLYWGLCLLKSGQGPICACWWGKLSTGLFYGGSVLLLVFPTQLGAGGVAVVTVIIILALLFSLLRYGFLFRGKIRAGRMAGDEVKAEH